MQIAIRHPDIVNKIIVIAGACKRAGFIPGFFEGMQHATLKDMPALLQAAYLKVVPDKERLLVMFTKDKERMLTFKDWPDDDLRSIKAPTLLMVADQDVVTPEHTVQMQQLIPGARLAILPGIHGSFIGEAGAEKQDSKLQEIAVALIEDFLTEHGDVLNKVN
jgi:pimeloyl-ACP methyl ester carboxylesterase